MIERDLRPSGDQSKLPTTMLPLVSCGGRFRFEIEHMQVRVTLILILDLEVAPTLSRSFFASETASCIVNAICLPEGEYAKEPTPSSVLVRPLGFAAAEAMR